MKNAPRGHHVHTHARLCGAAGAGSRCSISLSPQFNRTPMKFLAQQHAKTAGQREPDPFETSLAKRIHEFTEARKYILHVALNILQAHMFD